MIIAKNNQQKKVIAKNSNGSLFCICIACEREVANGPGGYYVKQPPFTSELKIANFANKLQFVIKRIVIIMNF